MPEQSPSQLINDWAAAAQSNDTPKNKATKIASLYVPDTATDKAVLCATEGIIQGQSEISADYEQNFTGGWVLTGISNQSINQQTGLGHMGNGTGALHTPRRTGQGFSYQAAGASSSLISLQAYRPTG